MERYDTIILGAGAAGLMCAAHASAQGARVLVVDHAKKPGDKIRISGGGRCNFTNLDVSTANFISANPHFAKSALARYSQWDFIDLVARHGIAWHEKTLGQLFCDGKATQIIQMLLSESKRAELRLSTSVDDVSHDGTGFCVTLSGTPTATRHLVVATGGKSIPKMGATGLAYKIAGTFAHPVTETRPALVPFTFAPQELDWIAPLAGTALGVTAQANGPAFAEALLFTHRGLSGPAMLQISSYWREGQPISIDLAPGIAVARTLDDMRQTGGKRALHTALSEILPAKLAAALATQWALKGNIADQSGATLKALETSLHHWTLTPTSTEGYRTAEVTLGGIDTAAIDSKTMQSRHLPGLYFIGECVDVTGWLGGYNFQWAWSSGWAAGTHLAAL
ncbi:NAD(P)/FAD-dependent oxidoreductase [Aliiroseovarius sp. PTFE2010]|uniref:NAD(P)/FAD-dependent oxidoreductase n=1 Tax=Aliiroseovarius sp. PTFE2010 TaxID=3417190 RepID=UPI003CF13765